MHCLEILEKCMISIENSVLFFNFPSKMTPKKCDFDHLTFTPYQGAQLCRKLVKVLENFSKNVEDGARVLVVGVPMFLTARALLKRALVPSACCR